MYSVLYLLYTLLFYTSLHCTITVLTVLCHTALRCTVLWCTPSVFLSSLLYSAVLLFTPTILLQYMLCSICTSVVLTLYTSVLCCRLLRISGTRDPDPDHEWTWTSIWRKFRWVLVLVRSCCQETRWWCVYLSFTCKSSVPVRTHWAPHRQYFSPETEQQDKQRTTQTVQTVEVRGQSCSDCGGQAQHKSVTKTHVHTCKNIHENLKCKCSDSVGGRWIWVVVRHSL